MDPTKLVSEAKTVISLGYNYHTTQKREKTNAPKISTYAYGEDYHFVLKQKLRELLQFINDEIGQVQGRAFVDSAPVLERAWAAKSGLGWVGKHSLLLNRDMGSYFFLAELIVDLPIEPDGPIKDYCGTCTRCIDACPTDAIVADKLVDGSKCISYFTIELKGDLPNKMADKFEDWMFGCDICQQVCPWNRFAKQHNEPAFEPHPDLLKMNRREWREITHETFNEIFRKSAVKRTKYEGLKRNIAFLDGKSTTTSPP